MKIEQKIKNLNKSIKEFEEDGDEKVTISVKLIREILDYINKQK